MTREDKREAVGFLVAAGLSAHRACLLVSLTYATFRYQAHSTDDTELVNRVRDLAARYPRYGYRRITAVIRQTQLVNQKRVRCVWRQQHLQVKRLHRPRSPGLRSPDLKLHIMVIFGPMILSKMRLQVARHFRC